MSIMDSLRSGNGKRNGDQSGISFQEALRQVNEHPEECFRAAGFQVPKEIMGDQQKTVMHLIRTGQVGGPAMRMVAPILARMGIKL
jgi:hypothetical protein